MSPISAVIWLEGTFDSRVGIGGDGNIDIKEREGIVEGDVLVSLMDIMFNLGRLR